MRGSRTGDDVTGYFAWNDALARRFFRPEAAGQPVHFFVTEDLIEEIGRTLGGGVADFLATVRAGPQGCRRSGHCQRALEVADGWRERDLDYPPYIAYLALFVLAGGHEGDFAPQAYYPSLWQLLGEDRADTLPSFERMLELWDDLEQWAIGDRGGELGHFEARIVGGKIHVGLPLAQTILTESEREALRRVFADAGLDPARAPSSRELRRALVVHGRGLLRPRTMRALERAPDADQEALLDAVADDFSDWDGELPVAPGAEAGASVFAGLRICLSLDRVAGVLKPSLRLVSRREFPEEGLRIAGLATDPLECAEFFDGWSTPLSIPGTGRSYEPEYAAWQSGLKGSDATARWTVQLERARVRVFVEGKSLMLPGVVEVLQLPPNGPFYLAFDAASCEPIREWLESDCDGWSPINISRGLPDGWSFGTVERARSDRGICDVRPELGYADRVSLRFVGGIRTSRGNRYYSFAPPSVTIHGASDSHRVYVAGRKLEPLGDSGSRFPVPDDLPTDARLLVEVRDDADEAVKRSALYLVSGVPWRIDNPSLTVDRFGSVAQEEGDVCGALCREAIDQEMPADLLRTPGLAETDGRIYFLGQRKGEVAVWPRDPLPRWQAVWAVPFRRRGRAIFCGEAVAGAEPLPETVGERSDQDLWRDLLWRRRKRIAPPTDRGQEALWRLYTGAASDR